MEELIQVHTEVHSQPALSRHLDSSVIGRKVSGERAGQGYRHLCGI